MNTRFDFSNLIKRASSWCAMASLSAGGGLAAYALFPGRLQALTPDWVLLALGGVAVAAAVLTPFATSFQQRFKSKTPSTPE